METNGACNTNHRELEPGGEEEELKRTVRGVHNDQLVGQPYPKELWLHPLGTDDCLRFTK